MTTAIGLKVQDDVFLITDSRVTGSVKADEQKIFTIQLPGVFVSMALVGSMANATMAIDDCRVALNKLKKRQLTLDRIKLEIRQALKRVYVEYVDQRPESERADADFDVVFSIALKHQTHLFQTVAAAIWERPNYAAAGSGGDIAEYVLRPVWHPNLSWEEALLLSFDALAAAKEFDPQTGGASQILTVRSGLASAVAPFDVNYAEVAAWKYRQMAGALFLKTANYGTSEEEFTNGLQRFVDDARTMRQAIQESATPWLDLMDSLKSQVSTLSAAPKRKPAKATRPTRLVPKRGRKGRPPSRG